MARSGRGEDTLKQKPRDGSGKKFLLEIAYGGFFFFLVGAGDQPGAQLIINERERLRQVAETRELQEGK